MARKFLTNQLWVYMNGQHVGLLTQRSLGQLEFEYSQTWLQKKSARPISLSMPLSIVRYQGESVQNFFENLLPDNEIIRQRLQARFQTKTKKSFDLLTHIGMDCVGALQFLMQAQEEKQSYTIQATAIDELAIANLLKRYKVAPLGMDHNSDFRISIAGAQEKTALLWHNDQWCIPYGTTATSHIIKLPIGQIAHLNLDLTDSVENEWLCLKLLAVYGLSVNEAHIKKFEDVKTLVVKRFDRRWLNQWLLRLPQEDLCQALGQPPGLKYEADGGPGILKIMQVLSGSSQAYQDREQFMRAVFLFWVLGAVDGHAKNFSLAIKSEGRYQLTPLYDVMSAYPLAVKHQLQWYDLKMAMALKGKNKHYKWREIQIRHWFAMANACQFPEARMQMIIDDVFDRMETVIGTVEKALPKEFPQYVADAIFDGMRKIRDKKRE